MKKTFTPLLWALMLIFSASLSAQDSLFISEVADPGDEWAARFIELYNAGSEAIDFNTTEVHLVKQTNGGNLSDHQLVGTITAGGAYVIARDSADFRSFFGFDPNDDNGNFNTNGDDGYFLYTGGDNTTGTLIDAYGVIDEDGSGMPWEYEDSQALRAGGITIPNAVWTASEWEITPADVVDFTPGTHDTTKVEDLAAPVWEAGYPKIENIIDTAFDLVLKLDETSTVYGVLLLSGQPAPTVEEVKAGTGAGGAAPVTGGSFVAGTQETVMTIDENLVVETSYDAYLVAEDDEAVPNVQAAVVHIEVTTVVVPDLLLMADFENDLTPFTQISIVGDQDWYKSVYSGNGFAKISGYAGSAQDNDDYLISPAINLDGSTDNEFSFDNAMNFSGPGLQVLISTDFSGTYDSTSVVTATWIDISSNFAYSTGSYAWQASGAFDLSAYTGNVYIAFRYLSNPTDGAATWEVDNFKVTGFIAAGSDATLSDLQIDAATIDGFDPATLNYVIELPAGTTGVPPDVTVTATDAAASINTVDATDLAGDAAARTTTVTVTAADGTTTQDYTILFNPILEVANLGELRAQADDTRKYVVTGEVLLTYHQSYRNKKYVQDATGGVEIDDEPGVITSTYDVGDGITGITGTVEEYNGLLQFKPTADPGVATSSGNAIVPTVVTPAQVNASIDTYESTLVQLQSVTITEADGTTEFGNGDNLELNGVAESMVLRVHFYGTTLTGTVIPDSAHVTGIVLEYNGAAQVSPRSADDVEELTAVVVSTDAALSDLQVDGATVSGFSPALLSYVVTLPQGTTVVPTVTATTADANATLDITPATDLAGDEAARTTTLLVTAEDGTTTKTYVVVFQLAVSVGNELFNMVSVYPVPAMDKLYIDQAQEIRTITVLSITGAAVMQVENRGSARMTIEMGSLQNGIYMLRLENEQGSGLVKVVKQ
ncbi:MAG: DUF5017 domain-containing protein [Bacteroidota bacterium]